MDRIQLIVIMPGFLAVCFGGAPPASHAPRSCRLPGTVTVRVRVRIRFRFGVRVGVWLGGWALSYSGSELLFFDPRINYPFSRPTFNILRYSHHSTGNPQQPHPITLTLILTLTLTHTHYNPNPDPNPDPKSPRSTITCSRISSAWASRAWVIRICALACTARRSCSQTPIGTPTVIYVCVWFMCV